VTARITYVGHATVLIELGETRFLTDPVLRDRVFGIIRRAGTTPDLNAAPDAVLLSHQHPDHLDYASLHSVGAETRVIAARGTGRRLRRHGLTTVDELEPGDSTRVGDTEVVATPAEHDGRRFRIGPRVPALGYELRGGGARIYFAGDTDVFPGMAALEGVDVALLPIAGWGPTVGKGHLDPERAARAAALIRPGVVIPIHWGAFLRTDLHQRRPELLSTPAGELRDVMSREAPDVQIEVLQPGETFELG
jgi:L-ascorbate metabolism protein UlaG (beta-lactamase superfamily)